MPPSWTLSGVVSAGPFERFPAVEAGAVLTAHHPAVPSWFSVAAEAFAAWPIDVGAAVRSAGAVMVGPSARVLTLQRFSLFARLTLGVGLLSDAYEAESPFKSVLAVAFGTALSVEASYRVADRLRVFVGPRAVWFATTRVADHDWFEVIAGASYSFPD